MYFINDAVVLIVDRRLRLPTEILVKGMQMESLRGIKCADAKAVSGPLLHYN